MKFKHIVASAIFAATLPLTAQAALITTPLTTNDYITIDSLDWAWASPVSDQFWPGGNELKAPDFHEGWRFATAAEMASRPTLADFTRLDGSYIQAAQYWNTQFTHVDANDLANGYVSSAWGSAYDETLYVRDVAVSAVPAPATLALLGAGFVALAVTRRRQA